MMNAVGFMRMLDTSQPIERLARVEMMEEPVVVPTSGPFARDDRGPS
jgi:hypothetical protein